jgi:hypothetical protein
MYGFIKAVLFNWKYDLKVISQSFSNNTPESPDEM